MLTPCPRAGTLPSRQNPGNPAHEGGAIKPCRPHWWGKRRRAQKCPVHNSYALRRGFAEHSASPAGSTNPSPQLSIPKPVPFLQLSAWLQPRLLFNLQQKADKQSRRVAAITKLSEETSGLRLAAPGCCAKKHSTVPKGVCRYCSTATGRAQPQHHCSLSSPQWMAIKSYFLLAYPS